jgi:hypothetical protein
MWHRGPKIHAHAAQNTRKYTCQSSVQRTPLSNHSNQTMEVGATYPFPIFADMTLRFATEGRQYGYKLRASNESKLTLLAVYNA